MKANELRLMNYVYQEDEIVVVYDISKNDNDWYRVNGLRCEENYVSAIKPIPLTEEWLLKFGFKRYENGDANLGRCYSSPNVSLLMWYGQDRADVSFWQGDGFKYVNQLQNIYFALTNKELTL